MDYFGDTRNCSDKFLALEDFAKFLELECEGEHLFSPNSRVNLNGYLGSKEDLWKRVDTRSGQSDEYAAGYVFLIRSHGQLKNDVSLDEEMGYIHDLLARISGS